MGDKLRTVVALPLTWLTHSALADSILGDLEEGRRRRGSSFASTFWFWRTAVGIILFALGQRLGDAARSFVASGGGAKHSGGDFRQAFRVLRRSPGFAATAIVLLALGIGANTAVFSVVRAVLLRPLPYQNPERLVFIWNGVDTRAGNRHGILTGQHLAAIAQSNTTLESYAPFESWEIGLSAQIDLMRPDTSDRLRGAIVSPNFFELLGVGAAAGRVFASSDSEAAPLVILSHDLWRTRFGSDPAIIGGRVMLAGGSRTRSPRSFVVIGVLPPEFHFTYPRETQVYLLKPWTAIRTTRSLEYGMIARLKPGATAAQAQQELTAVAKNLVASYGIDPKFLPRLLEQTAMMAEPMTAHLQSEVRPGLLLLSGVAGLLLLIGCVNLGLLTLARTVDRSGELAVRAALGAGPRRIIRLLLVEGVVIAGLGGVAGVLLAQSLMPAIRALMPPVVPRTEQITIDGLVLLFAFCATAATAIVCGVVPAVVAMRGDLLAAVRRAGATATADRGVVLWRRAVISLQVAVVLLLLVGAGLLLNSFWRLQNVPLGFDADDVLTLEMRLLHAKYRQKGRAEAFQDDLLARVRALPGVQSAGITTAVPMRGVDFMYVIGPRGGKRKPGNLRAIDPSYFEIMQIPLRAGRIFTAADTATAPPVIVVSESYGRLHFGDQSPVGQRLEIDDGKEAEIVGVAGDVRYFEVARNPAPAFYRPRAQNPIELVCLIVRPQPSMRTEVAAALRDAVRAVDPEQPVEGLTTIGDIVSESTADRRFYAIATAAFASVALLLAVAGLFGVVSRSVTERRREFAIRSALGADSMRIMRLIVVHGLVPVAAGAIAGLAGAYLGSRLLTKFLFEVTPTDALTYSVAGGLVVVVALAACLVPARRALRVPPMVVLKGE